MGSVFRNHYLDIDYGMDNLPDLRSDSVINCRKSLAFLYPLDQTVLESHDQPRVRTRLPSQFCLAPELIEVSFALVSTPPYSLLFGATNNLHSQMERAILFGPKSIGRFREGKIKVPSTVVGKKLGLKSVTIEFIACVGMLVSRSSLHFLDRLT